MCSVHFGRRICKNLVPSPLTYLPWAYLQFGVKKRKGKRKHWSARYQILATGEEGAKRAKKPYELSLFPLHPHPISLGIFGTLSSPLWGFLEDKLHLQGSPFSWGRGRRKFKIAPAFLACWATASASTILETARECPRRLVFVKMPFEPLFWLFSGLSVSLRKFADFGRPYCKWEIYLL